MVKLKSLLRWISTPNNNTLLTAGTVTRLAEAQVTLLALSRRQTMEDVFSKQTLDSSSSSRHSNKNGPSSSGSSEAKNGHDRVNGSGLNGSSDETGSTSSGSNVVETGDCVILMPPNVDLLHREICAGFNAMIPYLRSISYTTLMPQQCIRLLKSHQVFPWIPAAVIQAMANRMIAYKYMISIVALSQLIELLALIGFRNETLQDEWMGRVSEGNPMTGFNITAPVGPVATPADAYAVVRCAGALYQVTHSLSKGKYNDVLYHTVIKERRAFLETTGGNEVVRGSTAVTYRDLAEEIFGLSHKAGTPAVYAGAILQNAIKLMPPEKQPPDVAVRVSEQYGYTPKAYFDALRTDLKEKGADHKVAPHLDTLAGILQLLPCHDVAIPAVRFIAVYLTAVCKLHHQRAEAGSGSEGSIQADDWDKLMHIIRLLEKPLFVGHQHISQARLECTGYYLAEMHRRYSVQQIAIPLADPEGADEVARAKLAEANSQ